MSCPVARVDVLGVPVTPCTAEEAVGRVASWIESGSRSYATFTGVHGVMESQRDPAVLHAHRAAEIVACDGAPLLWASRWAGAGISNRLTGRDFMLVCSARAEREGWSAFIYGGKPGVADRVAEALIEKYPALKIAGTFTPPFGPMTESERREVIATINDSNADLVWVGLSTPKQELWMAEHRDQLRPTALFGVGAAFDYVIGELSSAPRWIQRMGLEWLYRLILEPKRLAPRYLRNNPAFVGSILCHRPRLMPVDAA